MCRTSTITGVCRRNKRLLVKLAVLWGVGLGCLGGLVHGITAEGRALAKEAGVSDDTDFCILKEGEYHSGIYDPISDGYLYYAGDVTTADALAQIGCSSHKGREWYGNDICVELYWVWFYGRGRILKYNVWGID